MKGITMNSFKNHSGIFRLLILAALVLTLGTTVGCGKKGGSEKAGEKVDDALHEAGNGPKDLLDKDGPVEEAGEKVDKTLDKD
jgi:hypothetical protein